eukprot:3271864-Alexandrium_andersonii.AAC.1
MLKGIGLAALSGREPQPRTRQRTPRLRRGENRTVDVGSSPHWSLALDRLGKWHIGMDVTTLQTFVELGHSALVAFWEVLLHLRLQALGPRPPKRKTRLATAAGASAPNRRPGENGKHQGGGEAETGENLRQQVVIGHPVSPNTAANVSEVVAFPPKVGGGLVSTATPLADRGGLALKVPEGGPRPHSIGHGPANQDLVLW